MSFQQSLLLLFAIICLTCSCVTTNGYTAKTLNRGQVVLTPGVNNLLNVESNKQAETRFSAGLIPVIGISGGLADNLEVGVRLHAPSTLEGSLRLQLTPKSFDGFDFTLNAHPGIVFDIIEGEESQGYLKLGASLGKQISTYEPFVSFYRYSTPIEFDAADTFRRKLRWSVLTIGVGIPRKGDLIVPELNYLLIGDGVDGIITLGIGVRAKIR